MFHYVRVCVFVGVRAQNVQPNDCYFIRVIYLYTFRENNDHCNKPRDVRSPQIFFFVSKLRRSLCIHNKTSTTNHAAFEWLKNAYNSSNFYRIYCGKSMPETDK